MPNELAQILLTNLQKQADPKTKTWWENYVKGSPPFLGVKMANDQKYYREMLKRN